MALQRCFLDLANDASKSAQANHSAGHARPAPWVRNAHPLPPNASVPWGLRMKRTEYAPWPGLAAVQTLDKQLVIGY